MLYEKRNFELFVEIIKFPQLSLKFKFFLAFFLPIKLINFLENEKLLLLTNDHIKFETNSISSDFNDTINIIQAISKNNFLYFFCRKKMSQVFLKHLLKKKLN